MGLDELMPGNTNRAKGVIEEYVRVCIVSDGSGKCFVSVMDRFGMYIAFNEGNKGNPPSRNTAMQYYRQAKLWPLGKFLQHRAALEARLLKMGRHPQVTTKTLRYIACCGTYLSLGPRPLCKPSIFIEVGNVQFVRFIRVKTPLKELVSALEVLMQITPSTNVIADLPGMQDRAKLTLPGRPDAGDTSPLRVEKTPTVYSRVNRVLDRKAATAGVTAALTSHSFQHGGATRQRQRRAHDGWPMSTTKTGFNYIFYTSKEDHMVSKILGGHDTSTNVAL
ncbi:LOW QUALITY PROTEIN: Hypothetical protein PHPALM_37532 [Phytophthora palmivora]|uniref:Uncharacterized protein n=1 Tax=Phytophthora palmivora TaxID=4796 RepID=A0A2P4WX73_9STRA|nr:LOW QUALITY PROTEIN: Hypothetical protein PHPALM_37532 [Phytophthora palmivora]